MEGIINSIKIFSVTKMFKMEIIYCVICGKYRKLKSPKISYNFENSLVLSTFPVNVAMKIDKHLKLIIIHRCNKNSWFN